MVGPPERRWRSRKKPGLSAVTVLRLRLVLLRFVIVVLFALMAAQLWRMQVVEGRYYQQRAEVNRLRVVPVLPMRGVIYDSEGRIVARNIPSFTVAVVGADIPKGREEELAAKLASLLDLPVERVRERLSEAKQPEHLFSPTPVKERIDQPTAFALEERHLELPGVSVLVEPLRQYPEGPLLAQVLGYVGPISAEEYERLEEKGYLMNDKVGKTGVELTYEAELRGRLGREQVEVDASGRKVQTLATEPAQPGDSLVLTIDLDLQREMTEVLSRTMGSSKYAAAVAMDPRNGEILGMVSLPSYDDNLFAQGPSEQELGALLEDPGLPLLNHAISGQQPPGSIFKIVIAAAALQEGVAKADTVINDAGVIYVTSEFDPNVRYRFPGYAALGKLDFVKAIELSSDIYFYELAGGYKETKFEGLGPQRIKAYADRFGYGRVTGVDLSGEAVGLVPTPEWKRRVKNEPWVIADTYFMGIGQGDVLATPLQVLGSASAIANGGKLFSPHLVREIKDSDGRIVQKVEPLVVGEAGVSPENLALVRKGMVAAVRSGTARAAQVMGVEVAGKTGTAEFGQIDPATGNFPTHGWFVGFAPADNPEIAIVVFHQIGRGNETAAPAAGEILRYYFARKIGAVGR